MKQDDITAHLLLQLAAARLAIAAHQRALDPSQREQALQWLETLARSNTDDQQSQAAQLARGWLLLPQDDGES